MKKTYIAPQAEIVNIRLISSVLVPDGYANWSHGAGDGGEEDYADAQNHTGLWGEVDDEDPWANSKGADLWSGDADEEEW